MSSLIDRAAGQSGPGQPVHRQLHRGVPAGGCVGRGFAGLPVHHCDSAVGIGEHRGLRGEADDTPAEGDFTDGQVLDPQPRVVLQRELPADFPADLAGHDEVVVRVQEPDFGPDESVGGDHEGTGVREG